MEINKIIGCYDSNKIIGYYDSNKVMRRETIDAFNIV